MVVKHEYLRPEVRSTVVWWSSTSTSDQRSVPQWCGGQARVPQTRSQFHSGVVVKHEYLRPEVSSTVVWWSSTSTSDQRSVPQWCGGQARVPQTRGQFHSGVVVKHEYLRPEVSSTVVWWIHRTTPPMLLDNDQRSVRQKLQTASESSAQKVRYQSPCWTSDINNTLLSIIYKTWNYSYFKVKVGINNRITVTSIR